MSENYAVVKIIRCATKGEPTHTECWKREGFGTGCWGCLGNGRRAILANPIAVRPVNVAGVARLWRESGDV